jgi:hypothetical protein
MLHFLTFCKRPNLAATTTDTVHRISLSHIDKQKTMSLLLYLIRSKIYDGIDMDHSYFLIVVLTDIGDNLAYQHGLHFC